MSQQTVFGIEAHEGLCSDGIFLFDHGITPVQFDESMARYADFTDSQPDPSLETILSMMPVKDGVIGSKKLDQYDYSQDKEKEWHKYRTNYPEWGKPGGYTNRSLQMAALRAADVKILKEKTGELITPEEDPKEYYHFHPNVISIERMRQMHEQYGWGPIPPEVSKMHAAFTDIHRLARESILRIYGLLEERHPELTPKFASKDDLFNSPIRILQYHPGQGDMLAGGHTDKGLGTIQLAESHEGFRYRSPSSTTPDSIARYQEDPLSDPNMQVLRREHNEGVFFVSEAWRNEAVYPGSELTPLWHDVINLAELNDKRQIHGQNCARWAIIFFTNSKKAGKVSKDRTHQEIAA